MTTVTDVDTQVSPWAQPQLWDTLYAGGKHWPPTGSSFFAKFEIKGLDRLYRWDIRQGYGFAGAQEWLVARDPPPFTIDFYLWSDTQYGPFLDFISVFNYDRYLLKPGQPVQGVPVYHPQLANLSLYQVICEAIGSIEKQSDDLMYKCTIKLREFFPAIPITPGAPDKAPDAEDDPQLSAQVKSAQTQIAQLTSTATANGDPLGLLK